MSGTSSREGWTDESRSNVAVGRVDRGNWAVEVRSSEVVGPDHAQSALVGPTTGFRDEVVVLRVPGVELHFVNLDVARLVAEEFKKVVRREVAAEKVGLR